MQYVSLLEPAQRVPTIIELVNRSARFVDLVADQLTMAYEAEHHRLVSRTSGLQQQWVSEVLAGAPVDLQRAEKVSVKGSPRLLRLARGRITARPTTFCVC
jgi:hypothetical protein